MTEEELKRLYLACDPEEPLLPDDDRYVDVDHVSDASGRPANPRRFAWVNRIARKFELPSDPVLLLLTGLPGSGKSTELRRVLAKLEDPEGARLFPVYIDGAEVIDLRSPIALPDLLLAIVAETERAILQHLEQRAADPARETILERVWAWLKKTEIDLASFEVGQGAAKLVLELRNNRTFKEQVRASIRHRQTEFEQQVYGYMQALKERVEFYTIPGSGVKYAGIIVVFDSLEQLRGSSMNAKEVLESAEQVFQDIDARSIGVPLILTVPAALATRRFFEIQFIPMIKVRDKDSSSTFEPGVRAMREIVDKRLSPAEQEALFGSAHRERIDRLIDRSGGYPRELIKFLREAVELEHPLSEHAFEILLADRAGRYCRLVPDDAIPLLREIHHSKPRLRLPRSNADTAELTDTLLANNLLMLYQNHDEWTDVNPAIVSLLDAEPDDA